MTAVSRHLARARWQLFNCLALALLFVISTCGDVSAQVTWNGAASSNWSGANWLNGSLGNSFSQSLVFAGSSNASTNNDLTSGTASSITFSSGASPFTLAGNSVTLSGTIGNLATSVQTISMPIVLTTATHAVNTVSGGSLVISGSISGGNTTGNRTLFLNTAGGTLTLSGNNTYNGDTEISAGALVIGNAKALGSGSVRFLTSTNVSLDVTSGSVFNITNGIGLASASGTFVGTGNGSLISSGTLLYTGGNRTMGVGSGTFGIASLSTNSGSQSFTKVGAGTMVITGAADANVGAGAGGVVGQFIINGGVVAIGHNNALGSGTYNSQSNTAFLRGYDKDLTAIPNLVLLATNTTSFDGNYSLTFTGSLVQNSSRDIVNNVASGKSVTFSGTTYLMDTGATARTLQVRGTGTTIFSGPIVNGLVGSTGVGTLACNGPVVLSAANTLTGGITVSTGGLVMLNNPNALGSGSFSFGGTGSFDNISGAPITVSNNIRMGGGSGTFIGSNNSTFITTGTLFGLGNNNRTLTVASGTVEIGGLNCNAAVCPRFQKAGQGTLIINNAADTLTTGTFYMNGGTLILGTAAAIGSGTFENNSSTSIIRAKSSDLTFPNVVNLTSSTVTFDGSYGLTFSGSLQLTSDRRINNNIGIGKSLTFSGTTNLLGTGTDRTLAIVGTGNTVFSGPIIDGGTTGSGFMQANSGTTTLSAVNTYTGTTTVLGGRLVVGNAASLGNGSGRIDVGGGTLDLGGFNVSRSGAIALTSTISAATIQNGTLTNDTTAYDMQSGSVSATLAGLAGLTKTTSGVVTLSAANTYSGNTTVSAGTLIAGNVGAFGSGGITVNGGVLDLNSLAVANGITLNGGSLINSLSYAGTQSLSGTVSYGAGTVGGSVNVGTGGVLKGSGVTFAGAVAVSDGGVHAPGNSPGTQSFSSGLSYSGSSTLQWEIVSNTDSLGSAGTAYDSVSVTGGNLSITSGALLQMVFNGAGSTVNWNDAFWDTTHSWNVINFSGAGTSSGNFTVSGDNTSWLDFNSVSLASAMAANNRTTSTFTTSNSSGNLVLTYNVVVVPEPTSLALVGLGIAGLALARRRMGR